MNEWERERKTNEDKWMEKHPIIICFNIKKEKQYKTKVHKANS